MDAPQRPIVVRVDPEPPLAAPAPTEAPTAAILTAAVAGVASFVAPKYGSAYLALPAGRGITATVCLSGRCVTRVSNDVGPDQRVHPNRVADLSFADFAYLCECDPWVVGLIRVTVETGTAPSLPPTGTE